MAIFALSVLQVYFSHIQCSDLSRSFCSCLVKPAAGSADLKELVGVNLEFQVDFFFLNFLNRYITNLYIANMVLNCVVNVVALYGCLCFSVTIQFN